MRRIGPAQWLAITTTLPGACAAANGDTPTNVLLLATGIVGLAALTLLSERWRARHPDEPPLRPLRTEPITRLEGAGSGLASAATGSSR